jgi:glycosyltransferase involved in cell wall biosynthesis
MSQSWCIAHIDSERDFSGGEVQVFLLMEGLRRRGHRAILFCAPESRSAEEARARELEHVLLPMRNDADGHAVVRLRRGLRQRGVQLVHLHTGRANLLGGLAARWAGIPAVSSRRMDRTVRRGWKSRLVYGRLLDAVVSISPAVSESLEAGGVAPERIRLIYEAVDPQRIVPGSDAASVRASLGTAAEDVVLLAMAALVRRKGLDVLLLAMHQLASAGLRPVLWIAGEGPERAALEAQANLLGLVDRVRFLGQRRDSGDLLGACDIVVLPSRREGLGVSALEAMAAGRPVVCSRVGGLAHSVVHGRTGFLVPPEDVTGLAGALRLLIEDPRKRLQLGEEGPRRIAEGFLPDQMVEAHVALYAGILDPVAKGHPA